MEFEFDDLKVQHAAAEDAAFLAPLFDQYRVWCGEASNLNGAQYFLNQRLRNSEAEVFFVNVDQNVAGFVLMYPLFSSVSMEPIWILNDLFVADDFRRRGIGSVLLQTATEFAKGLGALRLELEADIVNKQAQLLYESRGWKKDVKYLRYTLTLCEKSFDTKT